MSRSKAMIATVAVLVLGGLMISRFIEGRGAPARQAEQKRLVKPPQRISIQSGEPVITLDVNAQRHVGVETATLKNAPYQDQQPLFDRKAWPVALDTNPRLAAAPEYSRL